MYKYKNDNKKTQNLIYIYVGNEGREYEDIFKKIKNLNLYETFISLSVKDIKRLEKLLNLEKEGKRITTGNFLLFDSEDRRYDPVVYSSGLGGKDLIGMKFSNDIKSYWIKRKKNIGTMDKQF